MTEERHEAPLFAAEIWTQDFTNMKQEYQTFDRDLQLAYEVGFSNWSAGILVYLTTLFQLR